MAKLVDALDLGSSGETHQSSNLCTPTNRAMFTKFYVQDIGADMTGLDYSTQILPRIRTTKSNKITIKTVSYLHYKPHRNTKSIKTLYIGKYYAIHERLA